VSLIQAINSDFGENMKNTGKLLLFIGAIWGVIAFNQDTTVTTVGQFIGSTYIPSQTVHNIGKIDERRNHLMLSGLMVLAGVILFAVGSTQSSAQESPSTGTRKCPYCAEIIKSEAVICRYCNRELQVSDEKVDSNNIFEGSKDKYCGLCVYYKYHSFGGYQCDLHKHKVKIDQVCNEWISVERSAGP
jgi:hypothetical protein